MRRYETILLAQPSLSEEERQPLLEKLTTLISDGDGLLVKIDEWGQRRLAYEIKKQTRAYYSLIDFCGDGALVKELERIIRFANALSASNCAAAPLGPKALIPLDSNASTTPAASGASGPTTTSPIFFSSPNLTNSSISPAPIATFSPCRSVPALPGPIYSLPNLLD